MCVFACVRACVFACVRACVRARAMTFTMLYMFLCSATDNDVVELCLQEIHAFAIKRQDEYIKRKNTGSSLCSRHIHYIPTTVQRWVKMLSRSSTC